MVKIESMKKKVLLLSKILGLAAFYTLVFIASIFLTMSILIKGDEIAAPHLIGKSLKEAYRESSEKGVFLKKVTGNYDSQFKPHTVIDQFPAPGTRIKEKSYIKVYVTSEVKEIAMPDLVGHHIRECEQILEKNELKKRYISYVESESVPVDFAISQSKEPGSIVPSGTSVDILISKGRTDPSYIMPDVIGRPAEDVVFFFEKMGFKIAKITRMPYTGLQSGIVVNQIPSPGFSITSKNLISIQVSE